MNYVDNDESLWILIQCSFDPTKRNNQMAGVVCHCPTMLPWQTLGYFTTIRKVSLCTLRMAVPGFIRDPKK